MSRLGGCEAGHERPGAPAAALLERWSTATAADQRFKRRLALRSLLAQHRPAKLLVVAGREQAGVACATHLYDQVGAGRCSAGWRRAWFAVHPPAPICRPQVPVPRGLWDDSTGFVTLLKYAGAESRAGLEAGMLQSLPGAYLAYGAAGALLRRAQACLLVAQGAVACTRRRRRRCGI